MHTVVHVLRPVAGGILRHWQVLAAHSRQHGFRTMVISAEANDLASLAKYAEKVVSLPLSASLFDLADLQTIRLLRRHIAEMKPEIIHLHGFKTALIGSIALGSPPGTIYTLHNYHPGSGSLFTDRVYPLLERFIARRLAAVICVSDLQFRYLSAITNYPRDKVYTIHNGIDPERFTLPPAESQKLREKVRTELGLEQTDFFCLSLTRLIPAKGLETLLTAAHHVGQSFPSAQFIIAGEGPDKTDLLAKSAKVNELATRPLIRLIGAVPDPVPYYAAADLYVLPSWSEGLPLSILEAQAAGLPVVATRVGGIPEIISAGETGLLVTAREPLELAVALCELLGNDAKRAQLGSAGQTRVTTLFTEETMVTKTYGLYKRLLSQGGYHV